MPLKTLLFVLRLDECQTFFGNKKVKNITDVTIFKKEVRCMAFSYFLHIFAHLANSSNSAKK
jgi:hypothetical protein